MTFFQHCEDSKSNRHLFQINMNCNHLQSRFSQVTVFHLRSPGCDVHGRTAWMHEDMAAWRSEVDDFCVTQPRPSKKASVRRPAPWGYGSRGQETVSTVAAPSIELSSWIPAPINTAQLRRTSQGRWSSRPCPMPKRLWTSQTFHHPETQHNLGPSGESKHVAWRVWPPQWERISSLLWIGDYLANPPPRHGIAQNAHGT